MPPEQTQNNDPFAQIVDRLKQATNVLVTVKSNPSVDALAACIGLTIVLNKLGKHGTAVFSGEVPSTIEFLEPDKTLEKNTDSLRDFIISLDKSKADKLRYKVEDQVVKIFITPYRTSISDQDLEFSQGDFNVDAVVALGVHDRNDLDQVIVSHGRILHDATVISINIDGGSEVGSINWLDSGASSLSEMTADLVEALGKDLLDSQIATALLTGVVAETDRFRNEKSSPHTMSVSGTLMGAGASTQLIASKLEEPVEPPQEIPHVVEDEGKSDDGMIEIDHEADDQLHAGDHDDMRQVADIAREQEESREQARRDAESRAAERTEEEPINNQPKAQSMILEPPRFSGPLTANGAPEGQYDGAVNPLSDSHAGRTLVHGLGSPDTPREEAPPEQTLTDLERAVNRHGAVDSKTLDEIEHRVNSPHLRAIEEPSEEPPADPAPEASANSLASVEFSEPLNNLVPVAPLQAQEIPPPTPEPVYAREAVQRAVSGTENYQPEPQANIGASAPFSIDHDGNIQQPTQQPENNAPVGPPPPPVPPPMPPLFPPQ